MQPCQDGNSDNGTRPLDCSTQTQSDDKLMSEKQILSLKPAPRLEQVGYKHSERVQDRKHRPE
jgi:hypothetical protein